jgi:two-component system response regulator YesN
MKKNERKIKLTDLFTKEHFDKIQSGIRKNFRVQLEATDATGKQIRQMQSKNCHPEFCKIVRSSATGAKRCMQDRIRSLNLAIETGQPYTSICHAGIVLVCVPVMDGDIPLGGLFFGKCLWEEFGEDTKTEIFKRLQGLKFDRTALANAASKLPAISGRRIHQASEFLFILLYETTRLDPAVVQWRRQQSIQQSKISDVIHEKKQIGDEHPYPYESERKLIGKVKIGDRTGAKEILNNILGTIMFQNPGELNVLKARLVELLSILSRAAVEGGVEIGPLLEKNLEYLNKVLNINTQAELCSWISSALNDFIESVYTSQDSQKITQIRPAVEFIEANYDHQLSLADVASSVHLSVSRLAHLFKEQMGITVIDMLTNVRIDKAKELLLSTEKNCTEICFAVGYNNQSYFTRTFKEMTGLTPRQFREQNQRPKK